MNNVTYRMNKVIVDDVYRSVKIHIGEYDIFMDDLLMGIKQSVVYHRGR